MAKEADGGHMNTARMKDYFPEEERATRIFSAVKLVSEEVGRSMA